ncbi:Type III site-specific deoxyribonuclease [Moraxella macacae 0408225]|uniref:Type III site-specific deoxyribonuclease n=1 Tax=Moraxella macacae 0408225 TaxID=1230338 RepID=L2F706_9GAMM|nr:DEAD/DEAH box helicase family protein [Moraxella macacae]ELA08233.1 Type III site-specific deoxyribonuclease [Moraxella macacae 0408225]
MTKRILKNNQNPLQLKDKLDEFLFNQIANNPDYQTWANEFELPSEISDNLTKTLRDYQINAIKHFIYTYENNGLEGIRHVLFNMATGTGKTLIMAALILYLYDAGYRFFLFFTNQTPIIEQAIKNLTDPTFAKYLFKKQIKFNNRHIKIRKINHFHDADKNSDDINLMFYSTTMLYNRLTIAKENSLTLKDFENNRTVLIADEAHHLNIETKKKRKESENKEINNWENATQSILNANSKNLLLEFTATVDLDNQAIFDKYKDKIIARYDFAQFNKDGYSKNVSFLYNEETHIADQKRLLIVNAVALSEYRKLYAKYTMNEIFNPIVLIKSAKINQSIDDRTCFHQVINSLQLKDFEHLRKIDKQENPLIASMFAWIAENLSSQKDHTGLLAFISSIKMHFAEHNSMVYNSENKQNADKLSQLDMPNNTMRAIFAVNALNEGWDVLGLFDIIHFDISAKKKAEARDIQLIGRGARLKPYKLPRNYKKDDMISDTGEFFQFDEYKRKFDNAPQDGGRILETFYYHFVKTGTFLTQLQEKLLDKGIVNQGMQKRTIYLKPEFMQSATYQHGFVLVNQQEYRKRTTADEVQKTFNHKIKADNYTVREQALSDKQNNNNDEQKFITDIKLTTEFFSRHMIQKALILAENNFFRFNNLVQHIVDLPSIDYLIDEYLPQYDIEYSYSVGKEIYNLSAHEKLQLLVIGILPQVRRAIDKNMPIVTGSKVFRPKPLSEVFKAEKNIYLVSYQTPNGEEAIDERGKAQSTHSNETLRYDIQNAEWYAYSENYGTSEEKHFVKFIADQIDKLKQKFNNAQIYLIRNELDYYIFNPENGKRFAPDYLMIINDYDNKAFYYQCLFEPKGGHLIAHDNWKQEALIALNNHSEIKFDMHHYNSDDYKDYLAAINNQGYQEIKCLGFKFYNHDNETEFRQDFNAKFLR